MLTGKLPSTRKKLMCQYVNFFQKLLVSPIREVRVLARIVGRDNRSVTGINLMVVCEEEVDTITDFIDSLRAVLEHFQSEGELDPHTIPTLCIIDEE